MRKMPLDALHSWEKNESVQAGVEARHDFEVQQVAKAIQFHVHQVKGLQEGDNRVGYALKKAADCISSNVDYIRVTLGQFEGFESQLLSLVTPETHQKVFELLPDVYQDTLESYKEAGNIAAMERVLISCVQDIKDLPDSSIPEIQRKLYFFQQMNFVHQKKGITLDVVQNTISDLQIELSNRERLAQESARNESSAKFAQVTKRVANEGSEISAIDALESADEKLTRDKENRSSRAQNLQAKKTELDRQYSQYTGADKAGGAEITQIFGEALEYLDEDRSEEFALAAEKAAIRDDSTAVWERDNTVIDVAAEDVVVADVLLQIAGPSHKGYTDSGRAIGVAS